MAQPVARRLAPFGTTVFAEMTALALEHQAINLSQGFPDFDGPEFAREAAARALRDGHNQYAPMCGVPELGLAIAGWWAASSGLTIDPAACITVTNGCTEAIAASLLGIVNPGDRVVMFEPYYDSYRACVALADGEPVYVTLRPGAAGFGFDADELEDALRGARVLLFNSPHNPTGKVFSRSELELIAALCHRHDVIAVTDEVYERLVYEPELPHIPLASVDGMAERTVSLSSLGKTFSLTGWKIGWAVAPGDLSAGVRAAHQFLSYAVATPLQHGAAAILKDGEDSVRSLVAHYREAREKLVSCLERAGMTAYRPQGSYFVMADHTPVSGPLGLQNDVAFCRYLTAEVGVAAIPPSAFYHRPSDGAHLVRFAFCKKLETLDRAAERLVALRSAQ